MEKEAARMGWDRKWGAPCAVGLVSVFCRAVTQHWTLVLHNASLRALAGWGAWGSWGVESPPCIVRRSAPIHPSTGTGTRLAGREQGLLSEAQDLFSARGLRCPQGRLCFPVLPWGTWMDFLSTGRFLCGHGRRHAGPAAPSRPLGQEGL